MLKTKFFKLPKTKEFKFVPRYYDERKEKLDTLLRKRSTEGISLEEMENNMRKERLKDNLSQKWRSNRSSQQTVLQANLRMVFILFLLCIVFYYAWYKFEPLLYNWLSK